MTESKMSSGASDYFQRYLDEKFDDVDEKFNRVFKEFKSVREMIKSNTKRIDVLETFKDKAMLVWGGIMLVATVGYDYIKSRFF